MQYVAALEKGDTTMEIQFDSEGMLRRVYSRYYSRNYDKLLIEAREVEMFVDKLRYEAVERTGNGYAYFVFRSVTNNERYFVMRSDFDKFMKEALQPDGTFVGVFGWRVSGRTQGIRVVGKVVMKLEV